MSQELQAAPITVTQRAVAALGYDNEKALLEQVAQSKHLVEITNEDSYKQVHTARMVLKNGRIEIQNRGKTAREDATKFSKAVIEEEKRLIGLISPEEQRLQKIQDDHDEAEERAKQDRIEAEVRRVEGIKERIGEIRSAVEACTRYDSSAELIAKHLGTVERIVIDESFAELEREAADTKIATLARLRDAHASALAREEERRKASEAQAELEKLRAEQTAREAKERSEREERERQEREKREAEEKAAREKLAAEQAEVARQQKVEQDRIDAENKRLADARAEFEAEQAEAKRKADEAAAARLAAEEAERHRLAEVERQKQEAAEAERKKTEAAEKLARKSKYPGEALIVDTLVKHFGVTDTVVRSWLIELRKAA